MFIAWVSGHVWDIICFALHQFRSTPGERDGLHHENQILLKGGLTPSSYFWRIVKTGWNWRSSTFNVFPRCGAMASLAAFHLLAFYLLSLFSLQPLTTGDNTVLLDSATCGWVDDWLSLAANRARNVSKSDLAIADALAIGSRWSFDRSLEYTRACYANTDSASQCERFVAKYIKSVVNQNAPCPFKNSACQTPAFEMQSALIDSHIDLGINAPDTDRVQFKKTTTCAPILLEGKYGGGQSVADEGLLPGDSVKLYNLGPRLDPFGDIFSNNTLGITNYTALFNPDYTIT
jgi:hypothetical protein